MMNTRNDNHMPSAHARRSHPVSLLSAAVATADKALIAALATREDIQLCAFHKWEAAGKPVGNGTRFWLEAEKELAGAGADDPAANDGKSLDHSLETQAAQENAKALNDSVDSHYRDNNRMFQQHGDRGHRHGVKND